MPITVGNNGLASDFINESEKDATPANDEGRVPKLESDAKIGNAFIKGGAVLPLIANQDLTIGDVVGATENMENYVSKSFEDNTVSLPLPDTYTDLSQINLHDITWLTATTFVVLYYARYRIGAYYKQSVLYCTGTIDTDTLAITLGTPVVHEGKSSTLTSGYTFQYNGKIARVNDTKFLMVGQHNYNNDYYNYQTGIVSGTTITLGAWTQGSDSENRTIYSLIMLTETLGVYATTETNNERINPFTLSGEVITYGTAITVSLQYQLWKVNSTTFGYISYNTQSIYIAVTDGSTITANVENTTPTIGAGSGTATNFVGAYVEDNKVAISYLVSADVVGIRILTISTTTVTYGDEELISAPSVNDVRVIPSTTTSVFVCTDNTIRKVIFSGITISLIKYITNLFDKTFSFFIGANGKFSFFDISSGDITLFLEGMAYNFIGVAQSTVSKGDTVNVVTSGVDTNQSGLSSGAFYKVAKSSLEVIDPEEKLTTANTVKAINSTSIII